MRLDRSGCNWSDRVVLAVASAVSGLTLQHVQGLVGISQKEVESGVAVVD